METDPPPPGADPLEAKLALARFIVTRSHGEEAATTAEAHFTRVVREGKAPDEVPEVVLDAGTESVHLPALLVDHLGVESTSAARRLLTQGAVKVGDETVTDTDLPADRLNGQIVQAGKRRFARVFVGPRTS
jgi:tyrosyl-tRNA synthetase